MGVAYDAYGGYDANHFQQLPASVSQSDAFGNYPAQRQPAILLIDARFKERHCDISGARAASQLVYSEISCWHLEVITPNMEHQLLRMHEQAKLSNEFDFIMRFGARWKKAMEIIDQAVENIQLSKPLLEASSQYSLSFESELLI
ncbi:hypothetical protein OROMI_020368 [Orobanche minor]